MCRYEDEKRALSSPYNIMPTEIAEPFSPVKKKKKNHIRFAQRRLEVVVYAVVFWHQALSGVKHTHS